MTARRGYPFCFDVRLRTSLRAELLVALVEVLVEKEFKASVRLGGFLGSQRG